jgi:hypothetical protein
MSAVIDKFQASSGEGNSVSNSKRLLLSRARRKLRVLFKPLPMGAARNKQIGGHAGNGKP